MRNHEIRLGYNRDDDGVHIECECGFDRCLGHSPSLAEVNAAAAEHSGAILLMSGLVRLPADRVKIENGFAYMTT